MGCGSSKAPPAPSQPIAEQEAWLKRRQQPEERRDGSRGGPARTPRAVSYAPAGPGRGGAVAVAAGPRRGPPPNDLRCASSSSLASSDSYSDVASDWDRYSWRPQSPQPADSGPTSPGRAVKREAAGGTSITDSGLLRLCKVSGCTFVNQYMVIKYLGRGSSGRVFLCMSLDDNRLYAVKIVRKDQAGQGKAARSGLARRSRDPLEDLRREIAVMRRAAHPNVVALREVVDDGGSNKLLLVMDYLEGGPVMTREGLERGHRVPEEVARLYFRDMCKALDYLHCRRRVVHGDLKPENALMAAAGRVALSDFGCSKVLPDADAEFDRCNGTPAFLAPEMMQPNARYRGRPADVYALGGCLYAFVFGRIPFKAGTVMELFEVVQTLPVTFPDQPHTSASLRHLLLGMLEKDPRKRLTLAQVMAHPWMAAGGALPPLRSCQQQPTQQQQAGGGAADTSGDWQTLRPPRQAGREQAGAAAAAAAELEALEQEERDGQQQDALLKASLQGLVAGGGLEVRAFQAGQHLMARGQPGAHLMYILEGECEVHYRTAPPPDAHANGACAPDAAAVGAAPSPASAAAAGGAAAGAPAAAATPSTAQAGRGEEQHAQLADVSNPSQQRDGLEGSDSAECPSQAAPQGRSALRSAAGLFHASSLEGGSSRAGSLGGSLSLADGGAGVGCGGQSAAGGLLQRAQQRRGEDPEEGSSLHSWRASGVIAEAAAAAADRQAAAPATELPGAMPAAAAGALRQQAQQQRQVPPLPGAPAPTQRQPQQARGLGGEQRRDAAKPSQQRRHGPQPQLTLSIPAASEACGRPASPDPSRAVEAPGGGAATPDGGSPAAADPAPASLPSPGPFGLQRRMVLDVEGAAAHLFTPRPPDPAAPAAAAGAPAPSPAAQQAAPQAGQQQQGLGPQGGQQQQGLGPQGGQGGSCGGEPGRQAAQAEPGVVGEELPPTLLEAASRAKEVLAQLRRGPRLYLAARRGPGDFVGEMEALGGSQTRRVATVVAASAVVRAALIPYPAAKAYLSAHPLAKQQLAQQMWLRQSEGIVLEALARLAAVGEDVLGLLSQ